MLANWINSNIQADMADLTVIDKVGIGHGVYGRVRELSLKKFRVLGGDSRGKPTDDRFFNKRAEMHWSLREVFEEGLADIPDDLDLKRQLGAIKYDVESGKIKIRPKAEIKKEIGHSPDECDAYAQSYCFGKNYRVSKAIQARRGRRPDLKPVCKSTGY